MLCCKLHLSKVVQFSAGRFICTENYVAKEDDELSVRKGVFIQVVERSLDGWWLVRYGFVSESIFIPGTLYYLK